MATDHILRIQQGDDPSSFVLIKITQPKAGTLDLTFEGTDGEYPFVGSIQHSRLPKLLHKKNTTITPSQWEEILSTTLLSSSPTSLTSTLTIDLRAHTSPTSLTLAFHNNFSGIQQRIGEISLSKNESHEIDTIAWTSTAAIRSQSLEQQVRELDLQLKAQKDVVTELRRQMDEFLVKKRKDEGVLMGKFVELLNLKKAKIRDQQYLLANARVDERMGKSLNVSVASNSTSAPNVFPSASPISTGIAETNNVAQRVKDARSLAKHREPGTSEGRKRKPEHGLSEGEGEEEDAGVKEEEEDKEVVYSGDEGARTPSPEPGSNADGEDTMSDLDSDDLDAGGFDSDDDSEKGKSVRGKGKGRVVATMDSSPPPRREMPFSKGKGKQVEPVGGDSTDESMGLGNDKGGEEDEDMTDDEL